MAGCTSPGAKPDIAPLPTAASPAPRYCNFVSRSGVQRAVGEADLGATGGAVYTSGGGAPALSTAACTLNGRKDTLFGVSVEPIRARADLDQEVVSRAGGGHLRLHLPARLRGGVRPELPNGQWQRGRAHRVAVRNWNVTVGENRSAPGRDRVQDVVAIARQVIVFLHLPTSHAAPYPTPTGS